MYGIVELRYKDGSKTFNTHNLHNHITGDDDASLLCIKNCKKNKVEYAIFHVFESEEAAGEYVLEQKSLS